MKKQLISLYICNWHYYEKEKKKRTGSATVYTASFHTHCRFKKTAPNTFGINKYLPEGEYVAHRTY